MKLRYNVKSTSKESNKGLKEGKEGVLLNLPYFFFLTKIYKCKRINAIIIYSCLYLPVQQNSSHGSFWILTDCWLTFCTNILDKILRATFCYILSWRGARFKLPWFYSFHHKLTSCWKNFLWKNFDCLRSATGIQNTEYSSILIPTYRTPSPTYLWHKLQNRSWEGMWTFINSYPIISSKIECKIGWTWFCEMKKIPAYFVQHKQKVEYPYPRIQALMYQ